MESRSLTFKTILLASGKILAAFSTIGITAILTRVLSIGDYATHKQALLMYAMCAPALTLGLPKALYFFLPGEEERPRAYLTENLLLLCGLGSAFLIGISVFGGQFFAARFENEMLRSLAPLVGVYGLAMLPMAALSAVLMATDRVQTLVRFQVTSQLCLLGCVGTGALFFGRPEATLSAYAGWAVCALLIALVLMHRAVPEGSDDRPSWTGIKAQLAFGVPLGLASMFGSLSGQIDKFTVSLMCSREEFAVYVTGALEIPLIGVVTGAMNAVILPELAKSYKAGELGAIVSLWQRAMNKAILILAPAMFGILLLAPEIMTLLFSETYTAASEPLRIYALALPARAAVFASVLMATDHTRWVTVSAVLGLTLNAGLNVLFVWWLGASGAAWASVLTIYLVLVFMLFPMRRALQCSIRKLVDWTHLLRVLLAAGIPAGLLFAARGFELLPDAAPWLVIALLGSLYGGLVLLAYRVVGISTVGEIMNFLRKRNH